MVKEERVIRYLTEGLGYKEIPSGIENHRLFWNHRDMTGVYVCKHGVVKVGETGAQTLTKIIHRDMEIWERDNEKIKEG